MSGHFCIYKPIKGQHFVKVSRHTEAVTVRRVCVVAPAGVTSWSCESSSAGWFLNLPTNIRTPLWAENPATRSGPSVVVKQTPAEGEDSSRNKHINHEMEKRGVQQEKISCSICLDPLTDPVTIPCGHSYCMNCIKDHWDGEDQRGIYSCPQCRKEFKPRPVLEKNILLSELVEDLKKIKPKPVPHVDCYAGPEDVNSLLLDKNEATADRKNSPLTGRYVQPVDWGVEKTEQIHTK
ncbi:hypothetical protein CCH79_00018614 [Gambusia affinis]|uniref:RING-type domain-containing protein n=1 Tax=Gambusia affinis TaxID=33528 RepID=A0A315VKI0_GAMAF|nr:hypothetical protein CCH79_00018614 [Gambusia affinis]